jgi:hypothetical protein
MIVEGTSPSLAPLELGFLVEARVSTPGLSQTIEMFNFVTGQWELVNTRAATTVDSIAHAHVTTNPARFIRQSDGLVRTKVGYKTVGLTLHYPWSASIDRSHWTLVL